MYLTNENKIPVGISSCLLGEEVRYDGDHKRDSFLADSLDKYVNWIPVCPEVGAGMGTPREPVNLVRRHSEIRVRGRTSGDDVTDDLLAYSHQAVDELKHQRLRGYVLKKGSPSCGIYGVNVYSEDGDTVATDAGVFAKILQHRFPRLPIEDEGRLDDMAIREHFMVRLFTYDRWLRMRASDPVREDIIAFQAAHKMLIYAHSPDHVSKLDASAAHTTADAATINTHLDRYEDLLMEALQQPPSRERHMETLINLMGLLSQPMSDDKMAELHPHLDDYGQGRAPLIVSMQSLKRLLTENGGPWESARVYLSAYPAELAR